MTLKVYLTDDDEDDRDFFKEAIEKIDIDVSLSLFNDGEELMKQLKNHPEQKPHLIFLDLNMPIKNGMECLMEIKKSESIKDIAVAIYSTSSSEKDIEETFIKGANIYINKPSNFKALKDVISKVLKINWQYHATNLNRDTFLFRL